MCTPATKTLLTESKSNSGERLQSSKYIIKDKTANHKIANHQNYTESVLRKVSEFLHSTHHTISYFFKFKSIQRKQKNKLIRSIFSRVQSGTSTLVSKSMSCGINQT